MLSLSLKTIMRTHPLIAIAGATVVFAACGRSSEPPESRTLLARGDTVQIPEGSPLRSGLVFDTVRSSMRSDVVLATAAVESDPAHTVRVFPPLAGRVLALHVALGDPVRVGQPLVTLDSPDFTSAQADYDHALVAFRQASNNLARERDLAQYGIAAQRDVEQAQTDYSQAQGDLRRAAAHLTLLGIDTATALKDQALVIRSPIAGRVTDLSVGVGEFHNDPTVSVMTVADIDTVYLAANVPEKDVHAVRVGEQASAVLAAYPRDTVRGAVTMVSDLVDTATRMTTARVRVPNPGGRLKPGMYGSIAFATRPQPAVVVPATSLLQVGDSVYVFVETRPWTLERRPVIVGIVDSGSAVVRQGLTRGQRIVASQVVLLQ
jgi:cobalt-zinc-cadmium efflux system membrane fusion protein